MSYQDAVVHLESNQRALDRIVELVDECRPYRSGGYNRVWTDGSRADGLACRGGHGDVSAITDELRQQGYASLEYVAASADAPLTSVRIAVHSAGISVSGSLTELIWYRVPTIGPEVEVERQEDGSVLYERRPLTDAPHHWYWVRIAS